MDKLIVHNCIYRLQKYNLARITPNNFIKLLLITFNDSTEFCCGYKIASVDGRVAAFLNSR